MTNTASQKYDDLFPALAAGMIGGELVQTVNARDLHRALGVGKVFRAWMPERIEAYGFIEGADFATYEDLSCPNLDSSKARTQKEDLSSPELGSSKARPQKTKEYALTLDMAKELAMVERNDAGRRVRRYFIECERRLRDHDDLPDEPLGSDDLPSAADRKIWGLRLSKVNAASRLISTAERIYGPEAARRLYELEPDLPELRAFSLVGGKPSQEQDPVDCLKWLLAHAADNGLTLGRIVSAGLSDKLAANALRKFGLALDATEAPGDLAVANQHDVLARVFASTTWCGDWRLALAQLPGARPSRGKINFRGLSTRAVIIPRKTVLAIQNPMGAEKPH